MNLINSFSAGALDTYKDLGLIFFASDRRLCAPDGTPLFEYPNADRDELDDTQYLLGCINALTTAIKPLLEGL